MAFPRVPCPPTLEGRLPRVDIGEAKGCDPMVCGAGEAGVVVWGPKGGAGPPGVDFGNSM